MKLTMNKLCFSVLGLLFAAVMWSPEPVMPQNVPIKFGFVNVKEIFNNYGKVQALSQDLRSNLEKFDQKKSQWEDKIRTEMENFQVQKDLMGEEAIKQKQFEIRNMQLQMAQELEQAKKNFNALEEEGMDPIVQELNEVVRTYAQKNGYDFILKKLYVAYVSDQYDLTDEIITALKNQ